MALENVLRQKIIELLRLGIVLFIAAERHHDIALEIRIGNFKKLDALVVHLAPREFRPESHANACGNSFLDNSGVITFERNVCMESDAIAKFITNLSLLLRSIKTNEFFVFQVK